MVVDLEDSEHSALLEHIEDTGRHCVERAVKSIPASYPIRGVVQAAMVLRVCLAMFLGFAKLD